MRLVSRRWYSSRLRPPTEALATALIALLPLLLASELALAGAVEIVEVNGLFIALFLSSALLFRGVAGRGGEAAVA